MRRMMSRYAVILILALTVFVVVELWSSKYPDEIILVIAIYSTVYSILYFIIVIVIVPFLSSEDFVLNPFRLFTDGVISICLVVLSFSTAYYYLGIEASFEKSPSIVDHVYFSAVTFSTLGFGDFRPSESARLLAAFQAIIGNLHLGIIVGAAFLAASLPHSRK